MNRTIKFRVWNKKRKRMTNDITLPIIAKEEIYKLGGQVDEYEWMQYIGKKGMNRVDIYEGDIVKFFTHETYTESWIGVIRYDNDDACFYIDNISDKYPYVKITKADCIEVIGNEFANPQLLQNATT